MDPSLEEQVIAVIAKRKHLPLDQIGPKTVLADIAVDSLDAIELVFNFEDTFNITIPDEAVHQIRTVEDVVVMLRAALASRAVPGL